MSQHNAWVDIKNVVWEDKQRDTCDECGVQLNKLPGVQGLPAGVMRHYCPACMQRYNVSRVPIVWPAPKPKVASIPYESFGSW